MAVSPAKQHYVYEATIARWVDGDTVWMHVDLGFGITARLDFRLTAINTPERGQPGWAAAIQRVNELAPVGSRVLIETKKATDKYGRWLADIWAAGVHINGALVTEGHAVPYP